MRIGAGSIAAAYLGSTAISAAYLGAVQVFGAAAPITRFAFEGDSITWRPGSYANRFIAANPSLTTQNFAFTSATIGNTTDAPGANSLWGRSASVIAFAPQVLTILIGANDLSRTDISVTFDGSGPIATDWLTRLFNYIAHMKANIPGLKVLVAGVLPQTAAVSADSFRNNPRRAVVNPLLRAAVGNQIDGYLPFGDALADADAASLDYFADGVHPAVEGERLTYRIFEAVMNPLVAGTSGSTPAAFTLQDQNNVALSGTSRAQMLVTGMGLGATTTASQTGGQIARNVATSSFGAGPVTVMNGDFVDVQATGAASNNQATNVAVTVGTRADTFTARTIPATAMEFEHSTDGRLVADSISGNDHVFNLVTFPAGRPVIMIAEDGNNVTGVSINGVAASQPGGADAGPLHGMWIAPPSQTLTAGQQVEVRVTSPNSRAWCSIGPGAIRNCTQEVATMAVRKLPFSSGYTDRFLRTSPVLPITNGGLALYSSFGSDTTFAGFLEGTLVHTYAQQTASSNRRLRWGSGTRSGELGINTTGSTGGHSAVIVALEVVGARIELSSSTVPETATAGTVIGTLSVVDGSGSYTFAEVSDPDGKFAVVGNELRVAAGLDFETASSHTITVSADNGVDDPVTREFVVSVTFVDTAAPVLTSPTDATNGATAMTGSVTTNEGNGTLFWYVSTSITPPTPANLKAGAGAAAAGSQAVSASGVQNMSASGLSGSTTYYTHFLHTDAANNDSAIVSADGFFTDAAPSLPIPASGLILFVEAADTATLSQTVNGATPVTTSGQAVGRWADKSGADFHLTAPGDTGARPTYIIENTKPRIRFDGTDDTLRRLAQLGLLASSTGSTIILAFKSASATTSGSNRAPFGEGATTDGNSTFAPFASLSGTDDAIAFLRASNGSNATLTPTSSIVSTNGFDATDRVIIVTRAPSGTDAFTVYTDSATTGTTRSFTLPAALNTDLFALGALARTINVTSAIFLACDLYAVAAWNRVLSESERNDVMTYFNTLMP